MRARIIALEPGRAVPLDARLSQQKRVSSIKSSLLILRRRDSVIVTPNIADFGVKIGKTSSEMLPIEGIGILEPS